MSFDKDFIEEINKLNWGKLPSEDYEKIKEINKKKKFMDFSVPISHKNIESFKSVFENAVLNNYDIKIFDYYPKYIGIGIYFDTPNGREWHLVRMTEIYRYRRKMKKCIDKSF